VFQLSAVKKPVSFFVSYARKNKQLADQFLELFKEQSDPSKRYSYRLWKDSEILVGEDWHEEIQEALEKCDFGILLVSLAFLASQYIGAHELNHFTGEKAKPVMPLLLQKVSFEKQDLKGLEGKQIFRLESENFREPRSFGELRRNFQREEFAHQFFLQVERRLDRTVNR
jgi:hypothetical protein